VCEPSSPLLTTLKHWGHEVIYFYSHDNLALKYDLRRTYSITVIAKFDKTAMQTSESITMHGLADFCLEQKRFYLFRIPDGFKSHTSMRIMRKLQNRGRMLEVLVGLSAVTSMFVMYQLLTAAFHNRFYLFHEILMMMMFIGCFCMN
jgi:hypothetical protein